MDAIAQFRDHLAEHGLRPDEIVADGRLHRFGTKPRDKDNGWYYLHLNGVPYGEAGCWDGSGAERIEWKGRAQAALSEAERDAYRRQVAEARSAREAEEARRHGAAGAKAQAIWDEALPTRDDHPYLTRKRVKAHPGLKVGEWPQRRKADCLLIPMRDTDGRLWNVQAVFLERDPELDRDKDFLAGARKAGCYFVMGKPDGVLCIAEGYATGASIHEATGYAVAIAFDAGNLESVARGLRAKFPGLRLILCADDDAATEGNPGLTKATDAARAAGGLLAIPDFGSDRPDGVSDFNDLAKLKGLEAVRKAVEAARPIKAHEASPTAGRALAFITGNQESSSDDWPDPARLPDDLPPVEPFLFDLLPASVRPWIEDISDRVRCPADFPAVGVMVALAAVLGRKLAIRPKERDDWHEVANLWGCVVGRPGVLKTPALGEVLRPLQRLESKALETFEDERARWEREVELAKIKRDTERELARKALKDGKGVANDLLMVLKGPEEPKARRYIVNDCSYEALGEVLRANPNGVLAYRDEMIGLLKSLDREGHEGARSFFLSAWTGKEAHTFDRIGRGLNLRIEACCLSLLGSIQPAVIGEYLRDAVAHAGGDGLLARLQLLVWPDISGEWRNVDRWPDTKAKMEAFETFSHLNDLTAAEAGATLEDGAIPYLRFDPAAQAMFNGWREAFEQELLRDDDHAALIAHRAKYRKLVPTLALITHLAERQRGAIGEAAVHRALAWMEYLESHARRAYASVTQAEVKSAKALLARLRSGALSSRFTLRDVYLKGWAHLSTPDMARRATDLLVELDYLRAHPIDTGGRPKTEFEANPKGLR